MEQTVCEDGSIDGHMSYSVGRRTFVCARFAMAFIKLDMAKKSGFDAAQLST